MGSFIDLMASDVWSDADIMNRMRAMVRSVASDERRSDLQTIMIAHMAGMRSATASELADVQKIKEVSEMSGAMVDQSRLDMALLNEVLALETAHRRLAQPYVEVAYEDETLAITNQESLDADLAERNAAHEVVDAASPQAVALWVLRNPAPEPLPEPAPEVVS